MSSSKLSKISSPERLRTKKLLGILKKEGAKTTGVVVNCLDSIEALVEKDATDVLFDALVPVDWWLTVMDVFILLIMLLYYWG